MAVLDDVRRTHQLVRHRVRSVEDRASPPAPLVGAGLRRRCRRGCRTHRGVDDASPAWSPSPSASGWRCGSGARCTGCCSCRRVSRERVRATERRHPTLLPPPPWARAEWARPTLARRSVVGVVDLPWLADPELAENDGTVPTVHAEHEGHVVCGATTSFLLPTLRPWPRSGRNPAVPCPECAAMIDPPVFRRRRRSEPRPVGSAPAVWMWNDSSHIGCVPVPRRGGGVDGPGHRGRRRLRSRRRGFADLRPRCRARVPGG